MSQSGLAKAFRAYSRQQLEAESVSATKSGGANSGDERSERTVDGSDTRQVTAQRAASSGRVLEYIYPDYFTIEAQSEVPLFEDETGITVEEGETPPHATGTRRAYEDEFDSEAGADFDVGHMDVIWPGKFVAEGWTTPIEDREGLAEEMIPTQVETVTVDGELQAMPLFTDVNVLFYREDKLREYGYEEPPATERELVSIATDILGRDDDIEHGYVWQGAEHEGLTIMWLNWLWGRGGDIRQGDDIVVNSRAGIEALRHAVDLIHLEGVTPDFVTDRTTDENRETFQAGETLFMRNWPYAISRMNEGTPVAGEFDIAPLPTHRDHPDAANACLGGWNLFINPDADNESAAQEFLQWMASEDVQRRLALDHSRLPVRESLYDDDTLRAEFEGLDTLEHALDRTRSRPSIERYPRLSEIIFTACNAAIEQRETPAVALAAAQEKIDAEIND